LELGTLWSFKAGKVSFKDLILPFYSQSSSILQERARDIASIMHNIIPTGSLHSDTSLNVIKYTLPFNEQNNFSKLFFELEKMKEIQVKTLTLFSD